MSYHISASIICGSLRGHFPFSHHLSQHVSTHLSYQLSFCFLFLVVCLILILSQSLVYFLISLLELLFDMNHYHQLFMFLKASPPRPQRDLPVCKCLKHLHLARYFESLSPKMIKRDTVMQPITD